MIDAIIKIVSAKLPLKKFILENYNPLTSSLALKIWGTRQKTNSPVLAFIH